MRALTARGLAARVWELARLQHGVVTRWQLLELGYTAKAIRHRIAAGRLHRTHPGVYAVGRPHLTREGHWMAAVLAAGPGALLSFESVAAHLELRDREEGIEVSIPRSRTCRVPGLRIHRRHPGAFVGVTTHHGIPITGPVRTMIDLATRSGRGEVEALVNQADKLDLIDPEKLRAGIDKFKGEPGVPLLREVLDRHTFTLTDSELERLFLPIASRAGLPTPRTQFSLNGFRVDFFWPDLGLVVETDGLRYHRTPAQQARQTLRDNAHAAAGLTPLRFTHAQVRYKPRYVESTLRATVAKPRR